jgi:hypothetical protein
MKALVSTFLLASMAMALIPSSGRGQIAIPLSVSASPPHLVSISRLFCRHHSLRLNPSLRIRKAATEAILISS